MGNDRLLGGDGNNTLNAGPGNDTLTVGIGDDILDGGIGRDTLSGGAGHDGFVFKSMTDSTPGTTSDTLTKFNHGNHHIDGSVIDGNADLAGSQHFTFVGTAGFTAEVSYVLSRTEAPVSF